jgi:hypothetical protein
VAQAEKNRFRRDSKRRSRLFATETDAEVIAAVLGIWVVKGALFDIEARVSSPACIHVRFQGHKNKEWMVPRGGDRHLLTMSSFTRLSFTATINVSTSLGNQPPSSRYCAIHFEAVQ